MGNKRFFAFGCSFTNYIYPTWADLIGNYYPSYQNWGFCGGGNQLIANSLYECHAVNQISNNDTVIVMLTSYTRSDLIDRNSNWVMAGNIYNQTFFDENYVEKYWSDEFGYYTTWFAVKTIKTLLHHIGCDYKILCAFDLRGEEVFKLHMDLEKHNRVLSCWNDIRDIIPKNNMQDFNKERNPKPSDYYFFKDLDRHDYHPKINDHLAFIKAYLPDYYNIDMDTLSARWEENMDLSDFEKTRKNFDPILENAKNFQRFGVKRNII